MGASLINRIKWISYCYLFVVVAVALSLCGTSAESIIANKVEPDTLHIPVPTSNALPNIPPNILTRDVLSNIRGPVIPFASSPQQYIQATQVIENITLANANNTNFILAISNSVSEVLTVPITSISITSIVTTNSTRSATRVSVMFTISVLEKDPFILITLLLKSVRSGQFSNTLTEYGFQYISAVVQPDIILNAGTPAMPKDKNAISFGPNIQTVSCALSILIVLLLVALYCCSTRAFFSKTKSVLILFVI